MQAVLAQLEAERRRTDYAGRSAYQLFQDHLMRMSEVERDQPLFFTSQWLPNQKVEERPWSYGQMQTIRALSSDDWTRASTPEPTLHFEHSPSLSSVRLEEIESDADDDVLSLNSTLPHDVDTLACAHAAPIKEEVGDSEWGDLSAVELALEREERGYAEWVEMTRALLQKEAEEWQVWLASTTGSRENISCGEALSSNNVVSKAKDEAGTGREDWPTHIFDLSDDCLEIILRRTLGADEARAPWPSNVTVVLSQNDTCPSPEEDDQDCDDDDEDPRRGLTWHVTGRPGLEPLVACAQTCRRLASILVRRLSLESPAGAIRSPKVYGDEILVALARFPNLAHLEIHGCTIIHWGSIISALRCWSGLLSLRLERLQNRLTTSDLESLCDWCPKLQFLVLQDALAPEVESLPEAVFKLSSLQTLSFSGGYSMSEVPEALGQLEGLRHLRVTFQPRLVSLPASLGALTRLTELNLEACSALSALPPTIGALRLLVRLRLTLCCALEVLPSSIGGLTSLQELHLRGCEQLICLPDTMGELTALRHLSLEYCRTLGSLPRSLGSLTALQMLDLRGCHSLTSLPDSLSLIPGLRVLSQ